MGRVVVVVSSGRVRYCFLTCREAGNEAKVDRNTAGAFCCTGKMPTRTSI